MKNYLKMVVFGSFYTYPLPTHVWQHLQYKMKWKYEKLFLAYMAELAFAKAPLPAPSLPAR